MEERSDKFEDPKIGPTRESSRNISSVSRGAGAEPGVLPNTGASINAAGGILTQLTDDRSDSTLRSKFPSTIKHVIDRKGYAIKVNATIQIPRSYFVTKYQQDQGSPDAIPDATTLQPTVQSEISRIKSAAEPLIDTLGLDDTVPGKVVVTMIPDVAATAIGTMSPEGLPPAGGFGGGGGGGGGGLDAGMLKYISLGGLALLALAMMFLMLRKVGGREDLPSAAELAGVPPTLPAEKADVVGEALESTLALEGLEMDDKAVRRKQMLDQISEMVKQNPDEVANVLGRWIRVAP